MKVVLPRTLNGRAARAARTVHLLAAGAFLLLLAGCWMLEPRQKVGRLAPKLTIDRWFQAPLEAHADWVHLHGKVVILNFWEPWNQASTDGLAHMNELAKRYAPLNNVQFITITSSDSTETLTRFTDIIPIRGWIAMDPDRTVFDAYGVHGYPDTWIIDAEGRVVQITTPRFVTEDVINAVIEGRTKAPREDGFID